MTAAPLVVGLGGNVGGHDAVRARFERAAQALAMWGPVTMSPLYETAPWGGIAQAPYLNGALAIAVRAPAPVPAELIATILEVELLLGRDRRAESRWGPRPIDLDVLWWGALRLTHDGPPALELPHPRLASRAFALRPLADLVGPTATIPGVDIDLGTLLALPSIRDQPLRPWP